MSISFLDTIPGWFRKKPPEKTHEASLTQTPAVTSEAIKASPSAPTRPNKPPYKRTSHGDSEKRNRHRAEKEVKEFLAKWELTKNFVRPGDTVVCMPVRRWPGPSALRMLKDEYGFSGFTRDTRVVNGKLERLIRFDTSGMSVRAIAKQADSLISDDSLKNEYGGFYVDA